MIALRRCCRRSISRSAYVPYELLAQLEVTMEDFQEAPARSRALGHPRGVRRSAQRALGRRGRPGRRQAAVARGRRMADEVRRAVPIVPPRAAEGLAAVRPAGLRQDADRQGPGRRDGSELHLRQGAGADVDVRGRVGARRARGLPQGPAGGPLHRLLRRDRRPGLDPRRRRQQTPASAAACSANC